MTIMIEIILSGEGNSDIGEKDYQTGEFVHGPVAVLTKTILRHFHKDDFRFHFISRKELKKRPVTLKGKKKRDESPSGKGHSNLAFKLGCAAKQKKCRIAVLMRDADKRPFEDVYNEIESGFRAAGFERGIPAVPVPKSEAWIICCLEPEKSGGLETYRKDMKKLLAEICNSKEKWLEIMEHCEPDLIRAPSFMRYVEDLGRSVKYLF